jgi:hypothetical protein
VGDAHFKTACEKLPNLHVAAFANPTDPVPKTPLDKWKYEHVVEPESLDRTGLASLNKVVDFIDSSQKEKKKQLLDKAGPHGIERYKENFEKYCQDEFMQLMDDGIQFVKSVEKVAGWVGVLGQKLFAPNKAKGTDDDHDADMNPVQEETNVKNTKGAKKQEGPPKAAKIEQKKIAKSGPNAKEGKQKGSPKAAKIEQKKIAKNGPNAKKKVAPKK